MIDVATCRFAPIGCLFLVLACGAPAQRSAGAAETERTFRYVDLAPVTTDRASTGGVSWVDYDHDGDPDLVVTNGYDVSADEPAPQPNRVYRNDGTGGYRAVDAGALTALDGYSSGSTWGDFDGDGDLDAVVTNQREQPNVLIRQEDRDQERRYVAAEGGALAADLASSFSAAWVDVDGDGRLDLFVGNGGLGAALPDALYRNDAGTLTAITSGPVVSEAQASGGGVWSDYDGDGDPDLFLPRHRTTAEGTARNALFRNDGGFAFTDVGAEAFADLPELPAISGAWGDMDNDGDSDLFIANMYGLANHVLENRGDGTFAAVTGDPVALDGGHSYGGTWGDLDNDGDLDLVVVNWGAAMVLYLNDGGGRFAPLGPPAFRARVGYASSVALADDDGDGDLDIYVGQWPNEPGPGEENALIRNDYARGHWLRLDLVGGDGNTSAIGARIEVEQRLADGTTRVQSREVSAHTSWRSQNELTQHIGLGKTASVDAIRVRWPSGRRERFGADGVDRTLTLREGEGAAEPAGGSG